jgi:hypothetical protein
MGRARNGQLTRDASLCNATRCAAGALALNTVSLACKPASVAAWAPRMMALVGLHAAGLCWAHEQETASATQTK